mgnify:FL=1
MNRLLCVVGLALPGLLPGLLHAQAVPYGLSVDRDRLQTQQPVEVVVNFEAADRWCGLRVDMGDGDVRDILVEDFPLTITKQYAAAGRYVLRAQGRSMARGLRSALGCAGASRAVTVVVSDPGSDPPGSRPDAVSKAEQRQREAQREQDQRDAELAREQLKRDAELARERGKRDREDRRDSPKRDPDIAVGPAPVPAATPRRPPAPGANGPRDRTLEAF